MQDFIFVTCVSFVNNKLALGLSPTVYDPMSIFYVEHFMIVLVIHTHGFSNQL